MCMSGEVISSFFAVFLATVTCCESCGSVKSAPLAATSLVEVTLHFHKCEKTRCDLCDKALHTST